MDILEFLVTEGLLEQLVYKVQMAQQVKLE